MSKVGYKHLRCLSTTYVEPIPKTIFCTTCKLERPLREFIAFKARKPSVKDSDGPVSDRPRTSVVSAATND